MIDLRKKKVVVASSHKGSANAISPVIIKLIKQNRVDIVVLSHGPAKEVFQSSGINGGAVDYYGIGDTSVDSVSRILEREKPNLVLTGTACQDPKNRNILEQTITLAARGLGIKSLAVLDFWAEYVERFSGLSPAERLDFLPDKIAVMDNIAVEEMLSMGFKKGELVITGNPYFDGLKKEAKKFTEAKKKALKGRIGLNYNFLVYYATTSFERYEEKLGYWDLDIIKIINETLLILPGKKVGLVIGLHPSMPEEDLAKINQYVDFNYRIRTVRNEDSQELILTSDLVLTSWSTIGVEAVLLGKPCISLQPGLREKDPLIVSKLGIIPVGYTEDDCKREIKKAILDEDYREREIPMRYTEFRTDGKATKRVINLINEMLR